MTKLQDFLNSAISAVAPMPRRARQGDLFGVELECEGKKVDWAGDADIAEDWVPHKDGSLRDNHGTSCEWVFNGPVDYDNSVNRIDKLFDYFESRKASLVCSNRTSTHVHFNMGDKSVYQLVNTYILFSILEGILDRYCGEDRNGNLFCLSSRHAEEQLRWLEDACFNRYRINFNDNQRYCSLNLASINKFGTVEFRGMRGLSTREEMQSWLDILKEFCEYSCYTMRNPVDVVENISREGPRGFVYAIFSKRNADLLLEGMTDNDISYSIYEGLRLVQMMSYRIGTEFEAVKIKGKDFWASFGKSDVVKDIEPNLVARPAGRNPRGGIRIGNVVAAGARARNLAAELAEVRERFDQQMNQRVVDVEDPRPNPWVVAPAPLWGNIVEGHIPGGQQYRIDGNGNFVAVAAPEHQPVEEVEDEF